MLRIKAFQDTTLTDLLLVVAVWIKLNQYGMLIPLIIQSGSIKHLQSYTGNAEVF